MCEQVTINVEVGDSRNRYRTGDFLNALDSVFCYFENKGLEREQVVGALKTYIKYMEEQ